MGDSGGGRDRGDGGAPLRGTIDFTPEIARIAAVEERTTEAYDEALANYQVGRIRAKELIQVIERTILPDLQAIHARVAALRGVPREQVPLATAAREYFLLREASWRRRAEGLTRSNTTILRDAEQKERAAMEAFRKMMPTNESEIIFFPVSSPRLSRLSVQFPALVSCEGLRPRTPRHARSLPLARGSRPTPDRVVSAFRRKVTLRSRSRSAASRFVRHVLVRSSAVAEPV